MEQEYKTINDPDGYRYAYRYERPAMTTDSILFTKGEDDEWYVLLIKRGHEPYKDCWAFPGGFLNMDETLAQCAARELMEETGISVPVRQFVGVYDAVHRDPRGRVITVAYMSFFYGKMEDACAGDDAAEAKWFPILETPTLAFDQQQMLDAAIRMMLHDN
ncbi:MAG: NUDIX hydrolase [Paludibacteraceae bacterium]|nr:NUDIX hydrolase [Paludibacteraceae bacterium]